MMQFRRVLPVAALVAVLASVSVVPSSAVAETTVDRFSDVEIGSENFSAINYLRKKGIVEGYSNGTFGVEKNINRAEFAKIVMMAAGDTLKTENLSCYPDVKEADWFAPYICTATALGYVKGYEDGFFKPEQNINFVEASKVIVNVLKIKQGIDEAAADAWYRPYVEALEQENAIPNSFNSFDHLLTRGEMAEMIWRIEADASYHVSNTFENLKAGKTAEKVDNPLEKFSSCTAMEEYFVETAERGRYVDGLGGGGLEGMPVAEGEVAEEPTAAPAPDDQSKDAEAPGGGDSDYSSTNVQVEGVDEADIVKTDGEYIYLVKGTTVRVVKAYPPSAMEEMSAITFGDEGFYPQDMYVDGDKMVISGYSYGSLMQPMDSGVTTDSKMIAPAYYGSVSKVYVLNIADKSKIVVEREMSFEGDMVSSRKVDDKVYVVLNRYDYSFYPYIMEKADSADYDQMMDAKDYMPNYYDSADGESKLLADCSDVYFAPGVVDPNFLMVVGFSIDSPESAISKEVVLGSRGNVYASRDNLYVAESSFNWWWGDRGGDDASTIVHKFALNDDAIGYKGKGKVPGTILNQFSMDEFDGNFRIATTKGFSWDETNPSTNNVYILDETLDLIGKLEGIAPGESIFSTRFSGEKLYMVTFKKIDPFFVISLADPAKPEVLGSLKLPGYSDYLHIYDENHVIGFGLDTVEATEQEQTDWMQDFSWYQGIKLAMFDVTDVTKPTLMHSEIIGDRGTNSPLSYDHKALLFSKEKGLMSFPVTLAEIPEEKKNDPATPASTYGDYTFQGAYVYNVSLDKGFELKGRVTHYEDNEVEDQSGYYWYGQHDIERILYIKDMLYTVSKGIVKANKLLDLTDVNKVELEPGDDSYWYGYPVEG